MYYSAFAFLSGLTSQGFTSSIATGIDNHLRCVFMHPINRFLCERARHAERAGELELRITVTGTHRKWREEWGTRRVEAISARDGRVKKTSDECKVWVCITGECRLLIFLRWTQSDFSTDKICLSCYSSDNDVVVIVRWTLLYTTAIDCLLFFFSFSRVIDKINE